MGDQHDSWLSGIGVDIGGFYDKAVQTIENKAAAVVQEVKTVVQKVENTASGAVKTITGGGSPKPAAAAKPKQAAPAPSGGVGGVSISGSVGRGGKNSPEDVKAVQRALGISDDGKCGQGTITAIENFQRSLNQKKPDGRIDPGGPTLKALLSGGKGGAAPAPAPTPEPAPAPTPPQDGDDSDDLLGGLKKLGGKIIQGGKDLKNKVEKEIDDDVNKLKTLGGKVIKNEDNGGGALGGASGGGAARNFSLLDIGVGGQFTLADLLKLPPDPGFPVGTVAFGQFAGKLTVKFKPTLLSSIKAPKPAEAEPGIKAICKEIYENGKFSWFGGVTVKGDTKPSASVNASFLKLSTKVGEATLEIKAFEIGLDTKKIVKASFGSTSANFPVFEHEFKGTKYEILMSVGGALEVSPNPAAGAQAFTSGGILLAIDVALVAGPPLAAAAVVGIGIAMAGEKGERDAKIIEGAIDARQATFDYAVTMTGSDGAGSGPRAKAATAVANAQLAKVASSRKISLEDLKAELRQDKNQASDFRRIHAQARQHIFSSYYAEVLSHLKKWRKEHSVFAAFTTEADDNIAVQKKVAIIFDKP